MEEEQQPPDPLTENIAKNLASSHFGRELAEEGHPVVALDSDGNIFKYTAADFRANVTAPSDLDVEEMRIRHHVASPGPWTVDGDFIVDAYGQPVVLWRIPGRDPQVWNRKDADFIAHAREDIGVLLRELRRLRRAEGADG